MTSDELPYYPEPGIETVINEPGRYKGKYSSPKPTAPGWILIEYNKNPAGLWIEYRYKSTVEPGSYISFEPPDLNPRPTGRIGSKNEAEEYIREYLGISGSWISYGSGHPPMPIGYTAEPDPPNDVVMWVVPPGKKKHWYPANTYEDLDRIWAGTYTGTSAVVTAQNTPNCIIQSVHFTKNGSVDFNCTGLPDDNLEIEMIITGEGSDMVGIVEYDSPYMADDSVPLFFGNVSGTGVQSVPLAKGNFPGDPYLVGTYKLKKAAIFTDNMATLVCQVVI